jgi:hypothetical protein
VVDAGSPQPKVLSSPAAGESLKARLAASEEEVALLSAEVEVLRRSERVLHESNARHAAELASLRAARDASMERRGSIAGEFERTASATGMVSDIAINLSALDGTAPYFSTLC